VVLETTQEDLEIIIHGAHKITMNKINKNKNNSRNNNKCINNSLKTKIKDNKNKNKNNSKMMMMMKKYQDTESKKVALKGLQGLQDQQDHRNLLKEDDLLPLNKL
jgi:methionine salvage enolase-phosphatase E1